MKRTIKAAAQPFSSLTTDRRAHNKLKPAEPTVPFRFLGFDRLNIWSSNAAHTAHFFCSMLGFRLVGCANAYTGSRDVSVFALQNGDVRLSIEAPLAPDAGRFTQFLSRHGDTVQSIALRVDSVELLSDHLSRHGQKCEVGAQECDAFGPKRELSFSLGGVEHRFVHRTAEPQHPAPIPEDYSYMSAGGNGHASVQFECIDHVGVPQPSGQMRPVVDDFYRLLGFYHFWSVDEKVIFSQQSTLHSTVVSSHDESVKLPIFEPAPKLLKSQIQEFLDYNGGPGVQHVAIRVPDIIAVVANLRSRGLPFLKANPSYYEIVAAKLSEFGLQIKEDLRELQKLDILVDFDAQGYLLQIFTKPVAGRPTLFFEFIQRHNHEGFGEGNFQRLFEAIENEQKKRGNLV